MVCEDQLSILGNGIEVDSWKPNINARREARRQLGLTDEFLWLAVGRLEAVKDYPTLLRAMAYAPEKARLPILGAGPLERNSLSWRRSSAWSDAFAFLDLSRM